MRLWKHGRPEMKMGVSDYCGAQVCVYFARQLFTEKQKWVEAEFLEAWRARVPEDCTPSLEMLQVRQTDWCQGPPGTACPALQMLQVRQTDGCSEPQRKAWESWRLSELLAWWAHHPQFSSLPIGMARGAFDAFSFVCCTCARVRRYGRGRERSQPSKPFELTRCRGSRRSGLRRCFENGSGGSCRTCNRTSR
jgi:Sister chromatid cohesion protein Dcc1